MLATWRARTLGKLHDHTFSALFQFLGDLYDKRDKILELWMEYYQSDELPNVIEYCVTTSTSNLANDLHYLDLGAQQTWSSMPDLIWPILSTLLSWATDSFIEGSKCPDLYDCLAISTADLIYWV